MRIVLVNFDAMCEKLDEFEKQKKRSQDSETLNTLFESITGEKGCADLKRAFGVNSVGRYVDYEPEFISEDLVCDIVTTFVWSFNSDEMSVDDITAAVNTFHDKYPMAELIAVDDNNNLICHVPATEAF